MTNINNYYWDIRRTGHILWIQVMRRSIGIMVHDGVASVFLKYGSWRYFLVYLFNIMYRAQHFQKKICLKYALKVI